ncbi:hypothetical protein FXO38_19762 [Capsicum annuum]|nr:hypothetical protein FXO38_19762 [Capsicum annuum]KAF3680023.1 hypothetical protein FXO37_03543 [Capsicum annuum]
MNMKDHFSEFFCTFKYNENGRYISFIAIQGEHKAVIITLEITINGGWENIAQKIVKFINAPSTTTEAEHVSTKQLEIQGSLHHQQQMDDRWQKLLRSRSTTTKLTLVGVRRSLIKAYLADA